MTPDEKKIFGSEEVEQCAHFAQIFSILKNSEAITKLCQDLKMQNVNQSTIPNRRLLDFISYYKF